MQRLTIVLFVTLFLAFSTSSADATHFCRGYGGYGYYRPSVSFSFGYYPRAYSAYYPRSYYYPRTYYYPRVYYPRVISYRSPYFCGSTGYYGGYAGATYYNPSSNYVQYQLPYVSQPAELSYGPQAVKQFMGVSRNFALGSLLGSEDRNALVRPEVTELKIRATNVATLQKARNYIAAGDKLFRDQKYHSALQQYKSATRFAPDLAEGFFRQGHALVATNRFDLATEAFKRGLKADSKFAESDFVLSEIYGDAKMAKTSHLETLASAALERERDSDLMFLLGVFLHYDGERIRAAKFFQRAGELAGADDVHLTHFLPRAERKRVVPAKPETKLVSFSRDT